MKHRFIKILNTQKRFRFGSQDCSYFAIGVWCRAAVKQRGFSDTILGRQSRTEASIRREPDRAGLMSQARTLSRGAQEKAGKTFIKSRVIFRTVRRLRKTWYLSSLLAVLMAEYGDIYHPSRVSSTGLPNSISYFLIPSLSNLKYRVSQ